MPRTMTRPNYDRQGAEDAFDQAKLLAGQFEAKDQSAKAALYAALEALFNLVRSIPDPAFIRELVETKGGKWGQVARQNEFQPLVKLVFDGRGIGEASRSQYAKVLKYAHILYSSPRAPSVGLAQWLMQKGGVEGVYQTALLHVGAGGALRTVPSESRLDEAKRALVEQRRSTEFELTENIGVEKGFVTALLWVGEGNGAHVVRLLETSQTQIEPTLNKLVGKDAERATLRAKPLYSLFRVLKAVLDLTPSGTDDRDRMVVLDTIGDGTAKVVRLRSANRAYTYTTVEARLPHQLLPIIDGVFEIREPALKRFVSSFPREEEWGASDDEPGVLIFSDPEVEQVQPIPFDGAAKPLYGSTQSSNLRISVEISADAIRSFLVGYPQEKARWLRRQENASQPLSWNSCLTLSWERGTVNAAPYRTLGASWTFLATSIDPAFGDDRLLDGEEFCRVARVLDELERDIAGWIVDTDEEQAALVFDLSEGDLEFKITMPLVKNLARDHTSVCERIVSSLGSPE